jgi:hypothetical protein
LMPALPLHLQFACSRSQRLHPPAASTQLARAAYVPAGDSRQPNTPVLAAITAPAGPVDAAYKAIDSLIKVPAELTDYSVNSVTEGIEALATTRVIIKPADDSAVSEHATRGKVNRSFSGEV